jgi:hypothetical protein
MARKPTSRTEFVMFDVFYVDGSQNSNRRIESSALMGIDGEAAAWDILEEQDRVIAEKRGIPAMAIKNIRRAGSRTLLERRSDEKLLRRTPVARRAGRGG